MKTAHHQTKFLLGNAQLWLLGIGASLIAIHLSWISKNNSTEILFINLAFLTFVCYSIKDKHYDLNLESSAISSCLGFLLIALVFLSNTIQLNYGGLLPFYPGRWVLPV